MAEPEVDITKLPPLTPGTPPIDFIVALPRVELFDPGENHTIPDCAKKSEGQKG